MTTHFNASHSVLRDQSEIVFEGAPSEKYSTKIARIERLGRSLFRVANCLISFGNLTAKVDRAENSVIAREALFCDGQLFPTDIKVYQDLKNSPEFANHPLVKGEPNIRFYAAHPIKDKKQEIVGCISLIDYESQIFDDEKRLLLADLAVMVEREFLFAEMQQFQLDLIKANRNLKRESLLDPILGTWNKSAITRSLQIEMDRCLKAEKPVSILFVSLDQISEIRKVHGVTSSDFILLKIVSRLRSCIRPFDALGRFANDTFLIVLPGASHLVAKAVAERMRIAVMSHPDTIEDIVVNLSISTGSVSTDMFPDLDPDNLISQAEKALNSAIQAGNIGVEQAKPSQPDTII